MTTPDAAALARAQTDLEQVQADLARLDEVLAWLPDAVARRDALFDWYRGPGQEQIAAVLAADPEAVTPPVANEDAVWEATTDWDERLQRLLRQVTAALTVRLDD